MSGSEMHEASGVAATPPGHQPSGPQPASQSSQSGVPNAKWHFTDFSNEGWRSVWDNQPPAPTCEKLVEITVVGRRCVYVNDHRVAGGKPYISENLPQHEFLTKLGEVLDAFSDADVRKALRERRRRREYLAAYQDAKKAGGRP